MKLTRLSALILCIVLTLSLASCSGSSPSYAKNDSAGYAMESAAMDYMDYGEWGAAEESYMDAPAASSGQQGASNDLAERKIIKTADIQFETTTYDEFLASLNACVGQFGGYTESSETYGGGVYSSSRSSRNASITLRIPADRYDGFMETVSGLGAVTYRSEGAEDVTMSYTDMESHIRALETEYQTLLDILDKAESIVKALNIQPEIFPNAMGTIQLEYDNSRRDHMEIEIGEEDLAEVFIVKFNGEELYEDISASPDSINERVASFYG